MAHNGSTSTTHILRHTDFRSVNLTASCLASQLLDNLPDLLNTGCTNRMSAGLQTAGRIHRKLTAKSVLPALQKRRRHA